MIEGRGGTGFLEEASRGVFILLRQHLDGDRALERGVAGFVHLAHAAGPEGGDDLIRTKPNAGGERHDPPGDGNREPAGL